MLPVEFPSLDQTDLRSLRASSIPHSFFDMFLHYNLSPMCVLRFCSSRIICVHELCYFGNCTIFDNGFASYQPALRKLHSQVLKLPTSYHSKLPMLVWRKMLRFHKIGSVFWIIGFWYYQHVLTVVLSAPIVQFYSVICWAWLMVFRQFYNIWQLIRKLPASAMKVTLSRTEFTNVMPQHSSNINVAKEFRNGTGLKVPQIL